MPTDQKLMTFAGNEQNHSGCSALKFTPPKKE